jgi:DNA topoisomerase VI subunit B
MTQMPKMLSAASGALSPTVREGVTRSLDASLTVGLLPRCFPHGI